MLNDQIEEAKRSIRTELIQISIGEIITMYNDEELEIMPDFQRLFRWPIEKKTDFIESILIGIPIPPVFAYEKENGTWELIDGLQRIATILEFMGVLRDAEYPNKTKDASKLVEAKYLSSLKDVKYKSKKGDTHSKQMEKSAQLFFRRARIDFQVLKHPSDYKTKFDLFQRLNRGGNYATPQEVRSCSMVLINPEGTKQIRNIARSKESHQMFQINKQKKDEQKDIEWIVRSITFTYKDFPAGADVEHFVDETICDVLTSSDLENILESINWTIDTLYKIRGSQALLPHKNAHKSLLRKTFTMRALETIVVGIARNYSTITSQSNPEQFVKERLDSFWRQEEVAQLSQPGQRASTRIQKTIPFGSKWFDPYD